MTNAATILARPMFSGGGWYNTGTRWNASDEAALRVLVDANADIAKSADALGRSDTSIAWRAQDSGLILPPAWAALVRPKKKKRPLKEGAPPLLAYPYVNRRRTENALLLAVNSWVPQKLPGREDVCQDIMLAILEGDVTIDALVGRKQLGDKRAIQEFIRSFRRANMEAAGYAVSLDTPIRDRDGQDTLATIGDRLVGDSSFEYWDRLGPGRPEEE